jgi:CRP/FNR family transcriptional regulator
MKRETGPKDLGFFSSIPSFSGVDKDTMQAVAQAAIPRTFEQGQVVFLEGEPCAGLYIVEGGWLRSLKMSPTGREQVIRFVGPGEVFNEIGVLAGETNLVTVEALETARLWIIPAGLVPINRRTPAVPVVFRPGQAHLHLMNL